MMNRIKFERRDNSKRHLSDRTSKRHMSGELVHKSRRLQKKRWQLLRSTKDLDTSFEDSGARGLKYEFV
jgi:hypothetical protein